MGAGRARVAASILNADLANLAREVKRAEKAGADRIHLDVMDDHFVPNLTFGPATVRAIRRATKVPLDAHLMISNPARSIGEYLSAGCDSVTIHVEIDEPIEPTLREIRGAGRAAGLAVRPATPLSALEPYSALLDIVMVMTVEPGFGGQAFMREPAAKILPARDLLQHKVFGGEVHVDGGINRETAEFVGGLGVDVLVAGTALFAKGRNMGREIRLLRALADEGYADRLNDGRPPIPRDAWARFATLPRAIGRRLLTEIESAGIPVIQLRGDGQVNPDGVRDYDLLVPATVEALVIERFGPARARAEVDAESWRATFPAPHAPSGPPAPAD